jgi:chromosome partitioning protein
MAIQSVIGVAELIVVPTRPSPHDLARRRRHRSTLRARRQAADLRGQRRHPKAKITSEAAVALSQHGTVAPITLHHRTDYAASMIDGRTVMEVEPEGRSAQEVIALVALHRRPAREELPPHDLRRARRGLADPGAHRPQGGFGRRVAQ